MPELKRGFIAGRMNKDLDERLVPTGEYRDALNVEISTSESTNAYAVESSNGNSQITASTVFDGYTNPKCIGVGRDTENDKIYWFVSSDNKDAVIEYDVSNNIVSPVVVSVIATSNVLEFSSDKLITGVNVIDGLLFFTDDNSEPKKININRFKAASAGNFDTHTQIYGGNFAKEHITVIKKYPKSSPNLIIKRTLRDGTPDSTYKDTQGKTFVAADGATDPKDIGTELTLSLTGRPDYKENDVLKFTTTDASKIYTARISIKEITDQTENSTTITGIIISIDDEMLSQDNKVFNVELEEGESFFQDKFPRFAYRWKYDDNEYSCFSPFTSVAFIPDDEDFVYDMNEGYNVNMVNEVRKITLNTFDTLPADVKEVDILYKESNSNLVYVVTTLKNNETSFTITSEQIEKVIEANQILRPFDAVPRKAKAQEIVGNRLLYGNYLQGYNFNQNVTLKLKNTPQNVPVRLPQPSAKSLRNYQLGVVYMDEFGRQSPVFTSPGGSLYLDGTVSNKKNILKGQIKSDAPSWATHYKYYIKENSSEYYNVIMDRYYPGEEGNFWISAPSSERNKLTLDSYLILKKQNAKNSAFNPKDYDIQQKKYKVLDIKNEAPDFLVRKKTLIGELTNSSLFNTTSIGYPREGFRSFRISGDKIAVASSALRDLTSLGDSLGSSNFNQNKYIKITESSDVRSTKFYRLESIKKVDSENNTSFSDASDYYEFILSTPFKADVNFAGTKDNVTSNLKLQVYLEEDISNNEEFAGRFFVKLKQDNIITDNIFGVAKDEFDQVGEAKFKLIDFNDTEAATKTLTSVQSGATLTQSQAVNGNAKRQNFSGAGFVIEHSLDKSGNNPSGLLGAGTTAFIYDDNASESYVSVITEKDLGVKAVGPVKGNKIITLRYIDYGEDTFNQDTTSPFKSAFNAIDSTSNKSTREEDFNFHSLIKDSFAGLYMSFGGDSSERKIRIVNVTVNAVRNYNMRGNSSYSTNRGIRYTVTLEEPLDYTPLAAATGGGDGGDLRVDGFGVDAAKNSKIRNRNTQPIKLWRKRYVQEEKTTGNPAVWETEPIKQETDLDFYYEASDTYAIASHGQQQTLGGNRNGVKTWFNCFSFGNGVESNRLRDDFNATTIDKGPIVSTVLDEPYSEQRKSNGIIYSGLFNSRVGVNKTNQFIIAEKITKDVNNVYGSIQKLHARDNNLVTLCEDKILNILANKDALFNADGNAQLISTDKVLGQAIPYVGDFGISKNPESFADYSYRSYFTDKDRGKVLRLSRDGLTEISNAGMNDYFSDNLFAATTIVGSYDQDTKAYNVTLNDDTVTYKENVKGWTSRKSFIPEFGISLNNVYYTFKDAHMYKHTEDVNKNTFYGASQNDSTIDFIFNNTSGSIKKFKTLNYEGDSGWVAEELTTDQETGADVTFTAKENKYFAALKHNKKHKITVSVSNSDGGNIIIPDSQVVSKTFGATANETLTFTVKPKAGYIFDASNVFTFGSYNTDVFNTVSASVNSIGNMIISVPLKGFKMPAADINVDIPLVTSGKVSLKTYTLAGTFNKTVSNATVSDYSGGGLINASSADGSSWTTTGSSNANVTLLNVLVVPHSQHAFTSETIPRLTVTGLIGDNYQVTGPTLIGSSYQFKVVGSIVNQNLTNENIKIVASPEKSINLATNAIWGADISTLDITKDVEERDIIVYGSVGAKVNLNASASSASGTDLKIDIINGAGFSTGTKELTIGSDGKAKATIAITANSTGANRNIFVRLTEATGYVITDEFDDSDSSDNSQVLYTISQTNEVQLTFSIVDFPTNMVNMVNSGLSLTVNDSIGAPSTSTPFTGLANTEDPTRNNTGNVTFSVARDNSNDTNSSIEKVDDLDITNDFVRSNGSTNAYDSATGTLILTNGTQLDIQGFSFKNISGGGRGGLVVEFDVLKYGSDDDVLKLKAENVLNLSNNLGGSGGTVSTVALTGAGSYIETDIEELAGNTFATKADDAAIIFQYEFTFKAGAAGKYPAELKIDAPSSLVRMDNATNSTTEVTLKSGSGDKFGRIREGDTGLATFSALANETISGGEAVSATITVSLR